MSPWKSRITIKDGNEDDTTVTRKKEELHESEINVFQQLCLNKHDDNAAIEILLDSSDSLPDLYPTSSGSTDNGSRILSKEKVKSVEGKKKFLDRFFFKSPKKSPQRFQPASTLVNVFDLSAEQQPQQQSSLPTEDTSTETQNDENRLTPPSSVSNVRTKFEDPFGTTNPWVTPGDSTVSFSSEDSSAQKEHDNFSNVSSLSGTRASTYMTPVTFVKHESLGLESIKDIRQCLQEMEKQLGTAEMKNQRISRQKVQRALFTVADSLENDEDGSRSSNESEIEEKPPSNYEQTIPTPGRIVSQDDDDDFACDDRSAFEGDDVFRNTDSQTSPFNLMSFFGANEKNQNVVEEVLDDLLWTEFFSSRKEKENTERKQTLQYAKKTLATQPKKTGHKISLQINDYEIPARRLNRNEPSSNRQNKSWWRNHPSSKFHLDDDDDDDDDDEEEDDDSSSSSNEFPSYLPTSITVKKRLEKSVLEPKPSASSFSPQITNRYTVTMQNEPRLIDTESRHGFEMTKIAAKTRLV
jgi:hypothetical protein